MKKKENKIDKLLPAHNEENIPAQKSNESENSEFPGYPHYPASDDIFNKEKEVDLNTEDLSKIKSQEDKPGKRNEKDFCEDVTGEDLDVIIHPQFSEKKSSVTGLKREQIGSMVMKAGKILLKKKSISEISEYRKFRVSQLSEEYKQFEFPHVYKVGLSKKLKKQRDLLINKEH